MTTTMMADLVGNEVGSTDGGTDDEKLRRRKIPVSDPIFVAKHDPPLLYLRCQLVMHVCGRIRNYPSPFVRPTQWLISATQQPGKEPLMSTEG